jgi:acetolactate synthase-1/2/3 large subunit
MIRIEQLASEIPGQGITKVFGIPGSGSSLALIDALEKKGVEFVLTHMECSAALMAGAAGKISGKPGVALCIKGPGLANMVPGISACFLENVPLLSISEAYGRTDPLTKAHKRMDHRGLLGSVTKGVFSLSTALSPEDLFSLALREVPGPVHLDLAEGADSHRPAPFADETGLSAGLEPILAAIRKASRPAIVAGSLSVRRGLSAFLNELSIPVFTTASAKGAVDETRPHAAGVYTGSGLQIAPESSIIPEADLIIGIGLRHSEVLSVKPFVCGFVAIDPFSDALGFGFQPVHSIPGTLEELNPVFSELKKKKWGADLIASALSRLAAEVSAGDFMPAHVFEAFELRFLGDWRTVLDTGNFCTVGEHVCRIRKASRYLSSGQGRYMGIGLPIAIGAALADGSVPTAVFLGDGSVGMFFSDIKLAVARRLPLAIVLMTDGRFGSVRGAAIRKGLTQKPLTIGSPSWRKAAEALGVPSERVASREELELIMKKWRPELGPVFIEAAFDDQKYLDMVSRLRA